VSGQPTPESLFSARVATDPSSPFVTFYDDATGERAELSAKSLGNWVAKTHFFLMDELGLGVGDTAFVALPVHWLAAPIAFGCWFAGLTLVDRPDGASVAFGTADLLAGQSSLPPDTLAVSMLSMGRSDEPPAGMLDYAAAVRPMPDAWTTVRAQAGADDDALDTVSRSALADDAAATTAGTTGEWRMLRSAPWADLADLARTLVAPLTRQGSLVLVRNGDPAALERRIASERVTVVVE
jgi:uncharacterized protein (TIGR03089 family)